MPPKQKALEKRAENEAAKKSKEDQDRELREAATWAVGAKDSKKLRDDEEKDAERRRKAAEKAALEAQEAAELSTVQRVGKPQKKKGKDDFAFLQSALANQPKTKAQKDAEKKKQEDEERKRKEAQATAEREAKRKAEEEYIKKMAAKGIVVNHTDELFVPLNNHLEEEDFEHITGLDDAIDSLNVSGKVDEHPERRQKAAYNAYYDAMLPILKEELPGLKLSQYKERIFDLWKSAPENPRNQMSKPSADTVA